MEFKITSSTLNSSYNYKDAIIVQGNFVKNAETGDLQSIQGTCYRKNEQGEMSQNFGWFNGTPNGDGEINYDLSAMSRTDSNLVWDAIDAIQAKIIPVDE